MAKHRLKWLIMVCLLGLFFGVVLWLQQRPKPDASRQTIVLLHGYGSSARATNALASAIQGQLGIQKRQKVMVTAQGGVAFKGDTEQLRQGGIYQLDFVDRHTNAQQAADALARFLKILKTHQVNQVALIGHSMGANAALRVLLSHGVQDTTYPSVSHLITLAAPFNSGLGANGFDRAFDANTLDAQTKRPRLQDASYHYFDQNRDNMPEQTKLLNIMGDIGDGSDGVVTNFSSQALNFWVRKGQLYQTLIVRGQNVQHSQVRNNTTVVQEAATFLAN